VDDLWRNLATIYYISGRYSRSAEAFKKATDLDPEDASAWVGLGLAQNQSEMPDEAVKSFERAISIDPRNKDAHYNLGLAMAGLDRLKEALEAFERVLEMDPEDSLAGYAADLTRSRMKASA